MSVKIREIDHEDLNFMLTIENDKSNWKYGINKSELSLEDALVNYYKHYKPIQDTNYEFMKYKKIFIFLFTVIILFIISYCFYYNRHFVWLLVFTLMNRSSIAIFRILI